MTRSTATSSLTTSKLATVTSPLWTLAALRKAYAEGSLTPRQLVADLRRRASDYREYNLWIYQLSEAELQPYLDALADKNPATTPLWGVPFAIKDNIDLAGVPTTAACPAFSYVPTVSASVVQRLIDAGAIPLGKTNLDQFATGLNGTRSPYGACRNAFAPDYISGGSSSGAAVAVALGLAVFSLGTDTAGSGRVPAAFNNLVGVKPTRGLISTQGLVPACQSLDCISLFALTCDDANQLLACSEGEDGPAGESGFNPFENQPGRYGLHQGALTLGVIDPAYITFFGDAAYAAAYDQTLNALAAQGVRLQTIDYQPFAAAARLLYEGPWVAERYLATRPLIELEPDALLPVIRQIIAPGGTLRATDLFRAQYQLAALRKQCDQQLDQVDALLTPTAGRCFTRQEMQQEPVFYNSQLGYYTNFMNLLDMAAVALPAGFTAQGLPFGVTLAGKAFSDRALLSVANRLQQHFGLTLGASAWPLPASSAAPVGNTQRIQLVVCGAHLQGLPLNWQLTQRQGRLEAITTTAPNYRLYALAGGPPSRPGLIRDDANGSAIDVEVWSLPSDQLGSFVANIPQPLGIGKLQLADGRWLSGFICEGYGIAGARDITDYGGWRAYLGACRT